LFHMIVVVLLFYFYFSVFKWSSFEVLSTIDLCCNL
jgi:hypothetical protein